MNSITFSPGDLVRARGREWVALPSPDPELLRLRPLTGSDADVTVLDPLLELTAVEPARFDLPDDAQIAVQSKAALLADALRLTLRRGAGPFRSAAQLAFEPRVYQLVPLLMALRQAVPRLLIADDVGIGKTLEAGMILREWIDRGELDRFTVLCPPHLVEQWIIELRSRLAIDAVAVTSGSAARLERNLPMSQTLFDANPFTVVSLDYIKAEKRRDRFARACPDFVVVDEAHACVGTGTGKQQRFHLLSQLAADQKRRLILLTATPHSGDEEAFGRLLSLLHTDFASMQFDDAKYRELLAKHFVQRRRIDLIEGDWNDQRAFPRHETTEIAYKLDPVHRQFQNDVLDYCLEVLIADPNGADPATSRRHQLFWSTLALMRCVGSSPAAAHNALQNRLPSLQDRLETQVYDEDGDDEDAVDLEPAHYCEDTDRLRGLIQRAENLCQAVDPKLDALVSTLKPLIKQGANPVVFCRFLATAEYVRQRLQQVFPKLDIACVTGVLTPDERRDRVADMAPVEGEKQRQRLLVATDCLSEGINLQQLFDTVVHFDLSWNPTRHQQREGRVDRFGQPAELVRSVMMFSPDSAIDGAVLEVILRKAAQIRKATGVTVPLPTDRAPITEALMSAMLLRRDRSRQLMLDLKLDAETETNDTHWRDVLENEKKSRARFAQNAMKPQEVAPEWQKAQRFLGTASEARQFLTSAMTSFGIPLELKKQLILAHTQGLDHSLRQRLQERHLTGTIRLVSDDPVPSGATLLTRTHPLVACLAESIVESALDPASLPGLGSGRVGAWETDAVERLTQVVVLRIRYQLAERGRKKRLLLAEEAAVVAFQSGTIAAVDHQARQWLQTTATADLATAAQQRLINRSREQLPEWLQGPLAELVRTRSQALQEDHGRLRKATDVRHVSGTSAVSRVTVNPVLPPDVIGLFVLVPAADA